ncbi:glycan-binding surface protein [Balneolaceae bacterium ANBcel3]|nr:glycan-binding surface protein [Balneolaceae bacterium ANBcel3]
MKQIHKNIRFLPGAVLLIGFLAMMASSCNLFSSDDSKIPEVTNVRYLNPDSVGVSELTQVQPGDMFVLQGKYLDHVKEVYFNGVQASFNPVYVTNTDMIISVPDMNFLELDPDSDDMNTIKLVSDAGEFIYEFPIVPPPASIFYLSREFGVEGKVIRIFGESLLLIQDVLFPGNVSAASFEVSPNADWIDAEIPAGVQDGGVIQIETLNEIVQGPSSSPFNDRTGMLCDFDEVNTYDWGAIIDDDPDRFPGATGAYAYMETGGIGRGNWAWWEDTRSVNFFSGEWISEDQLNDLPQHWALKFDVYIKEPIEYGTFLIRPGDDWDFIARYEPWEEAGGPYTTGGWITVTLPLDEFKSDNGNGRAVSSITSLYHPDEQMGVMFVNDDDFEGSMVEELKVAFDNFRIINIAND